MTYTISLNYNREIFHFAIAEQIINVVIIHILVVRRPKVATCLTF